MASNYIEFLRLKAIFKEVIFNLNALNIEAKIDRWTTMRVYVPSSMDKSSIEDIVKNVLASVIMDIMSLEPKFKVEYNKEEGNVG